MWVASIGAFKNLRKNLCIIVSVVKTTLAFGGGALYILPVIIIHVRNVTK